jgi:hypothetical protein
VFYYNQSHFIQISDDLYSSGDAVTEIDYKCKQNLKFIIYNFANILTIINIDIHIIRPIIM